MMLIVRPGSSQKALCSGFVVRPREYYLVSMSVRLTQANDSGGIYFITFTCYAWKPLFALTDAYDAIYKWFDYLTSNEAAIIGHVIMPNHLHLLTYLPAAFKTPNAVVANAKRFLSYEIVKRLEEQKAEPLLQELHAAVKQREAKKGQIHRVFEESFDCKACYSPEFVAQKLQYMHHNPVKGKWNLATDFALYSHSSAGFYFDTGASAYKKLTRLEDLMI